MPTWTDTAPATHSQSGLHKLGTVVVNAWNGYWEYRANRAAVAMLQSMDAQMLHDIGINRSEIESVVYRRPGDGRR